MTEFEDKIGLEIPAYLRGELSPADAQRIEALAAENPEIAADIEFQKRLMSAVKENTANAPVDELGWARLSKAMNAENAVTDVKVKALNDNTAKPLKFWRIAAAALAVISLGQAGVIASKSSHQDNDARYVTVSDDSYVGVDVTFMDEASYMHVTELMQSVRSEFVSGPDTEGYYKVKFESKNACLKALEAFNSASKVVEAVSSCK